MSEILLMNPDEAELIRKIVMMTNRAPAIRALPSIKGATPALRPT
jgi:hypothetical protein